MKGLKTYISEALIICLMVLLATTLISLINFSYGQQPDFGWATNSGGVGADETMAITVDDASNVYATGLFHGFADFDPSSETEVLSSNGGPDVFVTKSTSDGSLEWAINFGGLFQEEGHQIAVDSDGNVYLSGFFTGPVDFDPSVADFTLTSTLSPDLFIAKYDSDGNFLWAGQLSGSAYKKCNGLVIDSEGNVLIAGNFQGTMDVDPGSEVENISVSVSQDCFLIQLNSEGELNWHKQLEGNFACYTEGMSLDGSDNIYLSGYFMGTYDFNPDGGSTENLSSMGGQDSFVLKLDNEGNFEWVSQIGGSSDITNSAIAVDQAGNVYTAGWFKNTIDFDPGSGTEELNSVGSDDIYVSKLSGDGEYIWARRMGGADLDQATALTVDGNGDLFVSGHYRGTADFDPGTGTYNMASNGLWDIFSVKINNSGGYVWSESIGGPSTDKLRTSSLDPVGSILIGGFFQSTVDFDFSSSTMYLASTGSYDGFVQKLEQCTSTSSEIDVVECREMISPSGAYTWTVSGTYEDVVPNSFGCDSTITINLTIESLDVSVSLADMVLSSEQGGVEYQWVDCDDNFAPIVGATSQDFTPGSDGNYAVILTSDICTDTSECTSLMGLSIADNVSSMKVEFYPNPSSTILNIQLSQQVEQLSIIDLRGSVLEVFNRPELFSAIDLNDYPSGIYFLRIEDEATVVSKKFIVSK